MMKEKKIHVQKECQFCHQIITVHMTEEEYHNYERYMSGEGLIQEMLPEIERCDRELLKSGICGNCWKDMFGPAPWEQNEDEEDEN